MLTIQIPGEEYWDADREEFICRKATTLALEHSLLSLSKWESKWHVPFLDAKNGLTPEQMQDYVRCMTLNKGVPDEAYHHLTQENCTAIYTYMNDPMTATWFREDENTNKAGPRSGKNTASAVTSEVLYYDMVELGIPFECEKWHLNRLLTLIRVCNEKHKPPKKVSKSEQAARRKALNAKRKSSGREDSCSLSELDEQSSIGRERAGTATERRWVRVQSYSVPAERQLQEDGALPERCQRRETGRCAGGIRSERRGSAGGGNAQEDRKDGC